MLVFLQIVFDGFQSCCYLILVGFLYQYEFVVVIFFVDVCEFEEVECFWFVFFFDGMVFGSEVVEFYQMGFFWVNCEFEFFQFVLYGYMEVLGIVLFVEFDDDVIGVFDYYYIVCGIVMLLLMCLQIEDVVEVYVCQQW